MNISKLFLMLLLALPLGVLAFPADGVTGPKANATVFATAFASAFPQTAISQAAKPANFGECEWSPGGC